MLYEAHVGGNCKISGSLVILIPCKLGLTGSSFFCFLFLVGTLRSSQCFQYSHWSWEFFFLITMFHQVGFQVIYKVCNGVGRVCLYEHARLLCKLYIFSVPQLQRTIWWSTVLQLLNVKGRPKDEPDVYICSCLLWNITETEFLYLMFLCDPDVCKYVFHSEINWNKLQHFCIQLFVSWSVFWLL